MRLQNFDYTSPCAYFVTICIQGKQCILGDMDHLSHLGDVIRREIENIPLHHPEVHLEKYVIMPNHIHMILRLDPFMEKKLTLVQIVALFKAGVSRKAGRSIWQRSFYEHTIRTQAEYDKIWTYIHNNPAKWELDRFYSR